MTKKGLTLAQHKEAGELFREADRVILDLMDLIGPAYIPKYSDKLLKIRDKMHGLKSDMDQLVFTENPNIDTDTLIRVYYGNPHDRKN